MRPITAASAVSISPCIVANARPENRDDSQQYPPIQDALPDTNGYCRARHATDQAGEPGSQICHTLPSFRARTWRRAHLEFNKLWKSGLMDHNKAYRWLVSRLGIRRLDCPIGPMWFVQCKRTAKLSRCKLKALTHRKRTSAATRS